MLIAFILFDANLFAQVKIKNSVLGTGGAIVTSESNRVVATVGQPMIGAAKNTAHSHHAGFWYQVDILITSVEQISDAVPDDYLLEQNYPNPFNPSTTIQFALPKQSDVTLELYDLLGRKVTTLLDENKPAGIHKIEFDAVNLPSGVFFYVIRTEEFSQVKKLMVLK